MPMRPFSIQDSEPSSLVPAYRYRFANVEFDESTLSLQVAQQPVQTERLPLNLLAELLRRPNEVLTRVELFESLWQGRPTVDHVLANAVNKLRKALGPEAAARIVNVPRVGYRLIGPIERIAVSRRSLAGLALSGSTALAVGQAVPGRDGFQLERVLGNGRGTAVWLARDPKLHLTHVFKFAVDGERLAALKREYTVYRVLRQELGERDDFTRVLSANFSDSPYFLECDYSGPDLLTWASDGARLAAMSTPMRIALFLQIAQAVSAAHSVGVLHKDLKPTNVLVGGDASAWKLRLTDFDCCHLLEPARLAALRLSAMGMTVSDISDASASGGTVLYLAPELLAGQAPTTSSDLYALGLMLYQLLAGDLNRPLSTGWERDIGDELLVEDITAATEGRPQDRLGSVAELVERLTALTARHEERAQRTRESQRATSLAAQLQRSRALRPWVSAAIASLSIGLLVSLWFISQASEARRQAQQASARAQAINDFLNKDVLQSPDVVRAAIHKPILMSDVLRRASQQVGERFKGQARTEASVRRQLGESYMRMVDMTSADRQFSKALTLLQPLVPANDPELLSIRFGLAQSAVGRFHPEDALMKLEAAERAAGALGMNGNGELALLAARTRVEVLMDAKKIKEALPSALRLVELSDTLGNSDISVRFEARQRLCELYLLLDQKDKADVLLAEITQAPFNERSVGEVLYARAKLQLARERINQGQLTVALTLLTQVVDTLTRAFGPNEYHVGLANSELADLQMSRGEFASAATAARAALLALSASMGAEHHYVTITKANLAMIELELGHSADALRGLDEAALAFGNNRDSATVLAGINFARARALTDLGKPTQSLETLRNLNLELLSQSSWGPRDLEWQVQAEQGRAMIGLGQRKQGVAMLRRATAEMEKAKSHPWLLERYRSLVAHHQG
jgi:eukaryotic-like serine/threonine-protein kinase